MKTTCSLVEHCISSTKGHGLKFHKRIQYRLHALYVDEVCAKCINVVSLSLQERSPDQFGQMFQTLPNLNGNQLNTSIPAPSQTWHSQTDKISHNGLQSKGCKIVFTKPLSFLKGNNSYRVVHVKMFSESLKNNLAFFLYQFPVRERGYLMTVQTITKV